MKPRFVYIHVNATTHWSDAWAAWLNSEVEKLGYETFFETMPDSIIARAEYWLPFLKNHVKAGKNDVLIGWSTGAIAAMRYAETNHIKGSILISPYYTDLGEAEEKLSGYFNEPWQWDNIVQNQQNIAVFWGDDDPYVDQSEFDFVANKLRASRHKLPKAGHFIERQTFPELLEYIKQTF